MSSMAQQLEAERQAAVQAAAEAEAARLGQGGLRQQLAKTVAELDKQSGTAQEMKDRLAKLNSNYMAHGVPHGSPPEIGWHQAAPVPLLLFCSLPSLLAPP